MNHLKQPSTLLLAVHRAIFLLLYTCFVFSHVAIGQQVSGIRDVPLERVKIDDAFWSPKRQVWQAVTIRDCFAKFERDGAFNNFDRVARGEKEKHSGAPWFDGLIYETIRGASDFLRSNPDPQLVEQIDGYVQRICDAAEKDPNCYLNTYTQLMMPERRWGLNGGNLRIQHDVYNVGCLMEAAVHYYQCTGKTRFLKVATKLATHMAQTMGWPPKQNIVPGHALPEEALVKLYRLYVEHPSLKKEVGLEVEEKQFLELAEFFVQGRGHHAGRTSLEQYAQDDKPFFQQSTIEGHAVRAALLCTGVAAIASEKPDEPYFEVSQRLWSSMVHRRMYLTGGIGSIANDEKFGPDFDLPNDGYLEICGAVGAGFFHHQMHLLTGDARYNDELERSLYNSVLSGISLSGDRYLYESPLSANSVKTRWTWHACPCCPPMFLKIMGSMPGYVYSESDEAIYVNLFVASQAELKTKGKSISIRQITNYPFDEEVRLQVTPKSEVETSLLVRLPSWCESPKLLLNGREISKPEIRNGYAVLNRLWKSGDEIVLQLPMPVQFKQSHPSVAANAGRLAVQRGPLVYCFESIDNGNQLQNLYLSAQPNAQVIRRQDLLGGIDAIRCDAKVREESKEDRLYRTKSNGTEDELVQVTAIPFYAHSNREPTQRAVWMPEFSWLVQPKKQPTAASQAQWTASHCWSGDTVEAVNDQLDVHASDDDTIPRFTWWDHRGTKEWLQCDLVEPTVVSEVQVYWWDERRVNRHCRVPKSWRVLALQEGEWKPIAEQSRGGTEMDCFNGIKFPSQRIEKLRIEVELQDNWSAGILEARLLENP